MARAPAEPPAERVHGGQAALCEIGRLEAGDPEALGAQMAALSRRLPRVDVWGGCCGTWDDHLRAIAGRLRPGEAPAAPSVDLLA